MAKRDRNERKFRTEFRKHHQGRTRDSDLTRRFQSDEFSEDETLKAERVSGKGDLTRKRTIVGQKGSDAGNTTFSVDLDVDRTGCLAGRVLSVHGLASQVFADDGRVFQCATRRLLKNLSTEQRHVVVAGDRVWFRPEGASAGMIESIAPRRGVLSRTAKGKQHVIVANVDLLLIVTSAAQPALKPNLIDRFLVTAEKSRIRPLICINKADLVSPADLQPLLGVYGRMGYDSLVLSASTGLGIEQLRRRLKGAASAVAGQSGVGKSSLLNAVEPGLNLRVREVSEENEKGKHTTTTANLIPLSQGGFVVDTPGIRQFQLWDVIPAEVGGFFRDLRPYINGCRFPDCTHQHEADCAVRDAVADGRIDVRRYESYCQIFAGDDS